MLLGIVSDTHGQVEFARQAVRMLESLAVQQVIHCGDIGSADVVRLFQAWPTYFVFGNVDEPRPLEQAIQAAGLTSLGLFGELELAGRRIAVLHSDDRAKFDGAVASGRYDLVCYGHTHVARQDRVGRTLVLNPGALYRANPHTLAVVDLARMEATHVRL